MQIHHFGVCGGRDYCSANPAVWAHGAENVGPVRAIYAHHQKPCADGRPDIDVGALLADACFVLEPDFDRGSDGRAERGLLQQGKEVFLKASPAAGPSFW